MNYLQAPTHVLGVRTADAKLGTYSHWLPGTTRIDRATTQIDFYDCSTDLGRAETESRPHDPRAQVLLDRLLNQYVPQQMAAPLPPPLQRASLRARGEYLAFTAAFNLYSLSQLVEHNRLIELLGPGGRF
jgi:uncharacterized sulfatase